MENQKNFTDLFHKLINNECSPQEVDEFIEYATSGKNEEAFDELIMNNLAVPLGSEGINNSVRKKLETRLQDILKENKPARKRRIKPLSFRYYAAAIILMIFTSALYLSQKDKTSEPSVSHELIVDSLENDILPGGTRAILTLSNGKKVLLDSLQNGTLAQHENYNVAKLDSGVISYHLSGNIPNQQSNEIYYNTIVTPPGGQYQIILPDGSSVWLNSESSLRYPTSFSGKERTVELTGEGYFEIAKNAAMPFVVNVNNTQIEVLGTHFNVNSYADELAMKTTLLEGRVKIMSNERTQVLNPGEQLSITKNENYQLTKNVNTDQVLAWKNGLFDFSNLSLHSIAQQLERWYQVDISFEGNIPEKHISGIISKKNNISTVLKMLEFTAGIHSRMEGAKVIFYR